MKCVIKNFKKVVIFSLFLFHCGLLGAEEDEMCKEIRDFANSAKVEKPVSVSLTTTWGEFSKSCAHHNIESEKGFCEWLVLNTSTEYMHINVSRVVSCLINKEENVFTSELKSSAATGEFSMYELSGVNKGIVLNVQYSFGEESKNPKLTIKAKMDPDLLRDIWEYTQQQN